MPLQNRVDPHGDIHAVSSRGMFTGNRGVIHDPETKTLLKRRCTTRAWLICVCRYKNFRREPMGRNTPSGAAGWTELFFLDEVTALAAGHRPCFLCRRASAEAFARCVAEALGGPIPRAPEIDERLHRERLAAGAPLPELDADAITRLPDGAMFSAGGPPLAIRRGKALPWSFAGYGLPVEFGELDSCDLRLLTPRTTVGALRAGYAPVWHATGSTG